MAGKRIVIPNYMPALDLNGNPVAGAKITFWENGTTDLKAIYTSAALTTQHPNPITADAAGVFASIFADEAEEFSVAITDADGNPISGLRNRDNIAPSLAFLDGVDLTVSAAVASVLPEDTVDDFRDAIGATGSVALAGTGGAALVGNQLPAGSNLQTQTLSQFIGGGFIMPSMFAGTEEQQFLRAVTEASQSRNDGTGQTVLLPRGEIELTAAFNSADLVSIIGVNKRGSILKAAASWDSDTSPYMATVTNVAEVSMFDNAFERLTINCNHVEGLGGIKADAWQEGGGLERVLIWRFTTEGVRIASGFGGAAQCSMREFEIMGSQIIKATTGIYFAETSAVGAFELTLTNGTITGSPHPTLEVDDGSFWLDYGIKVENDSLIANAVHFECATTGIYLDGDGHHILNGITGAGTVTNLIEIASTFNGTASIKAPRRWGATNLIKDNRVGGLGTLAYDTDIEIGPLPLGIGQLVAYGNFDGASPSLTNVQGLSGIVHDGTGEWTLTLAVGGPTANSFTGNATSNHVSGRARLSLNTATTVKIFDETFAGTPTDPSEINFQIWRCA